MADHSAMKLGRKPTRHDPRTLQLRAYAPDPLPPQPLIVDYGEGVSAWGMMLNDQLGDCTCAAVCHAIQDWTMNDAINHPGMVTPADADVLGLYERWCGYNPADPSTDQGGVELDILNRWRQEGAAGHKIVAFAEVDKSNYEHMKYAVSTFGGAYIGLSLPVSAQNQDVWDVVAPDGGPWGGHAVYVVGYDDSDPTEPTLSLVTWGQVKKMTLRFWLAYGAEAYAVLGEDFLGAISRGPDGLDVAGLQRDLALITAA